MSPDTALFVPLTKVADWRVKTQVDIAMNKQMTVISIDFLTRPELPD